MFASPKAPIAIGAIAPPTMVMIRYEDPFLVFCESNSLKEIAKIVGNIIASHR